jgi:hypothetical protein
MGRLLRIRGHLIDGYRLHNRRGWAMRGTFVERVAGSRAHGNVDRHQPRGGSVATSEAGRKPTVRFKALKRVSGHSALVIGKVPQADRPYCAGTSDVRARTVPTAAVILCEIQSGIAHRLGLLATSTRVRAVLVFSDRAS